MNQPAQAPDKPLPPQLQAVATHVLQAQREAMTAIAAIELAHLSALPEIARMRSLVAVTLLKSSCDFGLAVVTLLATSLEDFAGSGLALHRTQIETYARGVFFESAASENDVRRFVRDDKMPRRVRQNGKSTPITTAEVLREAAVAKGMDEAKLQSMMDIVWNGLCGVVHGGRTLLQIYRTVDTIGAGIDERAVRALLSNTGMLTILACTGICDVGDTGADQQKILARIQGASDAIAAVVRLPASHE